MADHHSKSVSPDNERWIERFARFGIVCKGIVYCLIGILATLPVFGFQGKKMNKSDTFKLIYDQPFGKILLILIGVGLAGYVTWRFFQAFGDIENKGKDVKAKASRAGYAFSGLIYATLAFYALKLAFDGPQGGGNGDRQFIVNKILSFPAGQWILSVVAVLIFLNGLRQIYRALSGSFFKNVRLIGSQYENIFRKAGVIGYVSRGIVLLVVGYFFIRASLHGRSNEVQDTKEAFGFIENTFGAVLMGVVAIGLVGYGIFMFVKARYQKIDLKF